jgi:Ca2+-binding EF-hand superfamily protein
MVCWEIECRESTAPVIFEENDVDEDGQLSKDEFEYIYVLYCPDAVKTIDELYQEYENDADYDGYLSLEEFSELYCNECKNHEVTECTELALEEVTIFDADQNNEIDSSEFD